MLKVRTAFVGAQIAFVLLFAVTHVPCLVADDTVWEHDPPDADTIELVGRIIFFDEREASYPRLAPDTPVHALVVIEDSVALDKAWCFESIVVTVYACPMCLEQRVLQRRMRLKLQVLKRRTRKRVVPANSESPLCENKRLMEHPKYKFQLLELTEIE